MKNIICVSGTMGRPALVLRAIGFFAEFPFNDMLPAFRERKSGLIWGGGNV
ncbi:MAG: hypothetical protein ACLFPE_08225 [Bacteroidales bacterium]